MSGQIKPGVLVDAEGAQWSPPRRNYDFYCGYQVGQGDMEASNAALRAEIADLRNEVEQLQSRVAYLESKRAR